MWGQGESGKATGRLDGVLGGSWQVLVRICKRGKLLKQDNKTRAPRPLSVVLIHVDEKAGVQIF